MPPFEVIQKLEILWDRWQLEEVRVEGVDGIFQLRNVVTGETMQGAHSPALFTSKHDASVHAFLGRAPRRYRSDNVPITS